MPVESILDRRYATPTRARMLTDIARCCMSAAQVSDDRRFEACVSFRNACLSFQDHLTIYAGGYSTDEESEALCNVRFRASFVALFNPDARLAVEACDALGVQRYCWPGSGPDVAECRHVNLDHYRL
jgi:hypothetical protein